MTVCTRCLYRNDDSAAFCASCGAYLEWAVDNVAADGGAGVGVTSRPAKRRTSAPRSRRGAGPKPRRTAAPAPAEQEEAPVDDGEADVDPEAAALALSAERLRWRVEENRRRRAGMAPREEPAWFRGAPPKRRRPAATASPGPGPPPTVEELVEASPTEVDVDGGQPVPVQPSDEVPRPLRQDPVEEDVAVHPGDVVCGRCQTGNAPTRYFCRRCGTPLHGEAAGPRPQAEAGAVRLPWWRRLWRRLLWWRHRDDEVPDTPAEPRSWKERAWSALPVLVVVGLIAGALGPWRAGIGERLENARKRLSPRYEHVYPARVAASSARPEHPAEATVDRAPNTYWSEAAPTNGEREWLVFEFDRPVDLGRIGFFNGAQAKPQDFLAQPRVRDVQLAFDTGEIVPLTLKDRDAFQNYGLDVQGVSRVALRILSVYLSPQGGADASLGEVEFFTKH